MSTNEDDLIKTLDNNGYDAMSDEEFALWHRATKIFHAVMSGEYVVMQSEIDDELDNILHMFVWGKEASAIADNRLLKLERKLRTIKQETAR